MSGSDRKVDLITRVEQAIDRGVRFVTRDVWQRDIPLAVAPFYRVVRVVYLAGRGFHRKKGSDQAAALAFITVLSLVPLLAFVVSVAKGFGLYETLLQQTINPFLDQAFGPLVAEPAGADVGDGSTTLDVRRYLQDLLQIINETDFSSLGAFGLLFLLVTVLRLLMNIELALNDIWGVHRGRRFVRKVSDYVAILVIAPILIITTTAATGAGADRVKDFLNLEFDITPIFKLLMVLLIWVVFVLIYLIMPNTKVHMFAALIGGLVGGTMFHAVQLLFVWFQREVTNYSALYAGFAALPVFLIWVLMCWVCVLLGGFVAWAYQAEPELRLTMAREPFSPTAREALALRIVHAVATAFRSGDSIATRDRLGAQFSVPDVVVDEVVAPLVRHGVLARVDERGLVPAKDLDRIQVLDVLDAISGAHKDDGAADDADAVSRALADLRRARRESVGNRTLRELAGGAPGESGEAARA